MELVTEVQEMKNEYKQAQIEAKKNAKKVEELTKKLELAREEKKTQKQYEKDIIKAVENDTITTFSKVFERDGVQLAILNLSLKSTRDDILSHVPESDFEYHYLDNNYEKILNKVKKIYENDEKAKEEIQRINESKRLAEDLQKVAEQQTKKLKEEQKHNIIINIFNLIGKAIKWIFIILFGGIYFIWKVLTALAKGQ